VDLGKAQEGRDTGEFFAPFHHHTEL